MDLKERDRIRTNKRFYTLKEKGLCTNCHTRPNIPGKNCCTECAAKLAKQVRERQAGFVAQGLCKRCGKVPPIPGRSTCQGCYDYNHSFHLKQKAKGVLRGQVMKEKNLCIRCANPLDRPGVYCLNCLQEMRMQWRQKRLSSVHNQILQRDNFKCVLCGFGKRLQVHHLDGQGQNSSAPNDDPANLITICRQCHHAITWLTTLADTDKAISLLRQVQRPR